MEMFSGLAFLGAISIFIYGIRQSRSGLQLLAGNQLRSVISSLTENRFKALLTGTVTTFILQSSAAATVMLVGLAGNGTISLLQAMGVILGADIGSTFVVVLLSFRHVADYALILLVIGVLTDIFSRSKKMRYVSMLFVGFGLVFFGMQLMIHSTSPLKDSHLLREIFSLLALKPWYTFLGAILFTALVQNSATTLGLAIAMAFSGLIGLPQAIPIVLGANVGTSIPSLIASIGATRPAKQVALSHFLFKTIGALLVMGAILYFQPGWLQSVSRFGDRTPLAMQIALAHVLFNLILSFSFLPFVKQGARFIRLLIPEPLIPQDEIFRSKHLDLRALETPVLAFANAKREILRMAEISGEMYQNVLAVFETNDLDLIKYIEEQDDKVDLLDREIKFYLAKISQENLNSEQAHLQLSLLAIVSDLEEIGDIVNKNILELAEKKIHKNRHFSKEGWREVCDFHSKVAENFQIAISTITAEDETLARKVARHERRLIEIEAQYREAHLLRLHKGLKETIETSSIHLDLLSNFRRINTKLFAIVRAAVPDREMTIRLPSS
ncbi:MAG: Na/Pi cotransporter family protein [Deltaproteobacteria bacterium]|nr:Na/Pi cotransporter family protein [Deltaproteobacteria bacterium]